MLDDALVNDALAHTEFPENYRFLGRDVPALETPSMFQEALAHGAPIDALLITQSGKPTESLLGIVTPADLPRILPGE